MTAQDGEIDGVPDRGDDVALDDVLGGTEMGHPSCPHCGTVMRDDPRGFACGGCGYVDDRSAELDAIEIPPDFDGPDIHLR